jgi:drug/metabolite transporter (DMT)-like permease
MGFINNVVPFSLIFWGQKEIGSGLASVLNAATPLSGAIVAHFLTDDEKLHSNRLIGVLIGVAGGAILVGPASLGLDWGRALARPPSWLPPSAMAWRASMASGSGKCQPW